MKFIQNGIIIGVGILCSNKNEEKSQSLPKKISLSPSKPVQIQERQSWRQSLLLSFCHSVFFSTQHSLQKAVLPSYPSDRIFILHS